jgi:uncharacterized protein with HEPN domain
MQRVGAVSMVLARVPRAARAVKPRSGRVVVHRYLQVDPRIVQGIVERDLDDLLGFVRTIRDRTG